MALVGYARVSTAEQNTALQTDALRKEGSGRILPVWVFTINSGKFRGFGLTTPR